MWHYCISTCLHARSHGSRRKVDHGSSTCRTTSPITLLSHPFHSRVSRPHGLAHFFRPSLPSFRILFKRSPSSEIIPFSMLFLPPCESTHVSLRRLSSWPEISRQREKEEEEDECNGPFQCCCHRAVSVTGRGGMAMFWKGTAAALSSARI